MSQTPVPQNGAPDAATCRNCQTALSGSYCYACGQLAHEGETLKGRLSQALASVATPGGRWFESLVGLLTDPGDLTRTYDAGKRERFVSPFAILLFAMLVLHGVQWFTSGPGQSLSHEQTVTSALERADRSLEAYADGEATEQQQGPAILRGEEMAARSALSEEERRERALSTQFFTDQAQQAWNPVAEEAEEPSRGEAFVAATGAVPALFPVIGWLLIPILLPAMLAMFRWQQPASALGHTRFLAHALAFSALALGVATILIVGGAPWPLTAAAFALVLAVHTAFHLRGAYDLGWAQTVWRMVAFIFASGIALAALTAGVTLWRTLL